MVEYTQTFGSNLVLNVGETFYQLKIAATATLTEGSVQQRILNNVRMF